jgi:hypothetical protein
MTIPTFFTAQLALGRGVWHGFSFKHVPAVLNRRAAFGPIGEPLTQAASHLFIGFVKVTVVWSGPQRVK